MKFNWKAVLILSLSSYLAVFLAACGPKAFVKGTYDDPTKENLMNDQWSETDMQTTAKAMVDSMIALPGGL